MPSDSERRGVAENLRYLTIGRPTHYKEQFFDELVEVVVGFEDFHDFNVVLDKLADLIDPTCHVVGTVSYDWLDGIEYAHRLSCGHTCYTHCPEPAAFCDKCGCRVIEREENSGR